MAKALSVGQTRPLAIFLVLLIMAGTTVLVANSVTTKSNKLASKADYHISHSQGMHKMHVNMILLEVLNDGYYSQLLPVLSDSVTLTFEGQNCCGLLSKNDAIAKLRSLEGSGQPWVVKTDSPNETLQMMSGKSQATFQFAPNGQINSIILKLSP